MDFLLDKGADPNVEGGSTELTVQGVRARPMELKYRKLTNNERDSEGVATRQYLRAGRCTPPSTWPTGTSATSSSR